MGEINLSPFLGVKAMRLIVALFTMMVLGCATNDSGFEVASRDLLGRWENRESSFLSLSGWDSLEFKEEEIFECTNYPKDGSLTLPYMGSWSLNANLLIVEVDGEKISVAIEWLGSNIIKLITSDGVSHIYRKK